jgi:hypothetical protein
MSEIFQILFHLIILLLLFSFPLNSKFILNKFFFKEINLYDLILINVIIQSNIFLFFSFFNINSNYLLGFLLFCSIFFYILNIKEYLVKTNSFIKKNLFNFFIFLITLFSVSFYLAYNLKLGWDAIAHWFWKTQVFFQNGSILDFKNIPYSYYPHLGTYIWAIFWKFSILKLEYLGRLYFVFIYLVSLFSIIDSIKSKYKTLFFILLPFLVFDPFALSGYQELMIFSFVLAISRLFYVIKKNSAKNKNFIILLIILSLNLIIWSKQEGIFISSILIATFLISFRLSIFDKFKILSIALCFFAIYIYLETHLKSSYALQENIGIFFIDKYNSIYDFIKTFSFITFNIIVGILKRPILLLSLISLIYLTIFNTKYLKYFNFILIFFVLNITFIYSVYITTSFPLESYMGPTLGRVLLETSGFYLVSIVVLFDLLRKKKKNKKINLFNL